MRLYTVVFFVLLSIISCKRKKTSNIDVSNVDVNFTLNRYEVDFYNSTKKNLPLVKHKYPFLSPYLYSGNSPILFTDYNGEDFGIKINHKTKSCNTRREPFAASLRDFKRVQNLCARIRSRRFATKT